MPLRDPTRARKIYSFYRAAPLPFSFLNQAYTTVRSGTVDVPQRSKLSFLSSFLVSDNEASGSTDVSLSTTGIVAGSYMLASFTVDQHGRLTAASNGSSTPAYQTVLNNGSPRAQRTKLDFSSTFSVVDDLANTVTLVSLSAGGVTNAMLVNSGFNVAVGDGLALTSGSLIQLGGTFGISASFGTTSASVAAGNDSRFLPAPSAGGRIPYDTGAAWTALAAGSPGQVLQSNGSSAPTWTSLSSSATAGYATYSGRVSGIQDSSYHTVVSVPKGSSLYLYMVYLAFRRDTFGGSGFSVNSLPINGGFLLFGGNGLGSISASGIDATHAIQAVVNGSNIDIQVLMDDSAAIEATVTAIRVADSSAAIV